MRGILALGLIVCTVAGCTGSVPDEVWNSESAHKVAQRRAESAAVSASDMAVAADSEDSDNGALGTRPFVDWSLEETADDALIRLGTAALPHLEAELAQDSIERQRSAAAKLARLGPDAAARVETVELLVTKLETSDDEVLRRHCARALGQMGPSIWPLEPQPYRPITTLAVMPPALPPVAVDEPPNLTDAIAPPREIRLRLPYDESSNQRYQRFEAAQQDHQRRLAVARKAVQLLAEVAAADGGMNLSAAE